MHQLLLDLPTSLAAEIVNQWLSVKDRVRLDSAHCQASSREEFLELMRRPEFFVKSWVHHCNAKRGGTTDRVVSWALRRGIYIKKVSVGEDSDRYVYNAFMEKLAKGILIMSVWSTDYATLSQNITRCCNLLALDLGCCKLTSSLRKIFECCKRLREFTCRGHSTSRRDKLEAAHLEDLVCTNLKYLHLSLDTGLVETFLRMAVAVEVLLLDSAAVGVSHKIGPIVHTLSLEQHYLLDKGIQNIATRFTNLVNLALTTCSFTESGARSLGKFPNLRALDLSDSRFESGSYLDVLACSYGDQMTELLLYCCEPLIFASVQEVLPRFTQLRSFSVDIGNDYTVWELSLFSGFTKLLIWYGGEHSAALFVELKKISHTNLRELSIELFESEFDGESVDIIVSACTKLVTLNLWNTDQDQLGNHEDEERWQCLNPGLSFGGYRSLRLSVFDS